MTASVTRTYRFSASHRLHSAAFSEAENARLFGKCNNPFGHGHNYGLEVTVHGAIDEHTGMIVSITRLDRYVLGRVIREFDGKNMNVDIGDFEETIPTTENVTQAIAARLLDGWESEFGTGGPRLARVHVQETARNGFELIIEEHKSPASPASAPEEVALGRDAT